MAKARKKSTEVVIEEEDSIIETTVENEEGEEDGASAAPAPEPEPEETVAELKARLKKSEEEMAAIRAENKKKDEALRRESTRAASSEAESIRAYEARLEEGIASTNAQLDRIAREMEDALDEGDNKAYVAAQRELAKHTNYLSRLEADKANFEQWKEQEKTKASPSRSAEADDGMTPATRDWIARHPEFNTDARYNTIALAGHHLAQAEGIRLDSPEYFARIEKELDERYYKREASRQSAASSGARPSRETGTNGGQSGQRVRLTEAQLEAADALGMTPAQYAKNLLELQKMGKMGHPNRSTSAM